MGYATGQFGKNHLGDLNAYLPRVHGFDEFFGYLYHLDAMEDPFWPSTTRKSCRTGRAAQLVHSWRPTRRMRPSSPLGKVGKQTIKDEGTLLPHRCPVSGTT